MFNVMRRAFVGGPIPGAIGPPIAREKFTSGVRDAASNGPPIRPGRRAIP